MRGILFAIILLFTSDLLAYSVCIIEDIGPYRHTRCDESGVDNNRLQHVHSFGNEELSLNHLIGEIKRLLEQGYKQTGQSETINSGGRFRTIIMTKDN